MENESDSDSDMESRVNIPLVNKNHEISDEEEDDDDAGDENENENENKEEKEREGEEEKTNKAYQRLQKWKRKWEEKEKELETPEDNLANNSHPLFYHMRGLLRLFVSFISSCTLNNEVKRLIKPAIFNIIDNLMFDNGKILDKELSELLTKEKPTLIDLFSEYDKNKKRNK